MSAFGFSALAGLVFSEDASVDVLDFSAAGVEEGAADSLDDDGQHQRQGDTSTHGDGPERDRFEMDYEICHGMA